MIEILVVGSVAGALAATIGGMMTYIYRTERKRIVALAGGGAEALARKLSNAPQTQQQPQEEATEGYEAMPKRRGEDAYAPQHFPWQYQHLPQQPDNNQEPSLVELDLPQKMVFSTKSIIISAPPGSGKTFLVRAFLVELISQFKDIELLIIDQKNRPWMGLEHSGCVVVPTRSNYEPLTSTVATVAAKLEKRTHLSEIEVERSHRIWLVIDDYFSLYQNAPNVLDKAQLKQLTADLNYIITVGREFKVMACVITHSLNVEALGFNRDIRGCSSMLVLGRIDAAGEEQEDGGFGAIATAISNPNIIASEAQRTKLIDLLPEIESEATKRELPAFFTTMGKPRLGVIPDLRWAKDYSFSVSKSQEAIAPSSTYAAQELTELTTEQSKVAFIYSLPSEVPQHEQGLTPHLRAIIDYAKTQGGSVSVRQVQQRKLIEIVRLEANKSEAIQDFFRELESRSLATLSGEGGGMMLALATNE